MKVQIPASKLTVPEVAQLATYAVIQGTQARRVGDYVEYVLQPQYVSLQEALFLVSQESLIDSSFQFAITVTPTDLVPVGIPAREITNEDETTTVLNWNEWCAQYNDLYPYEIDGTHYVVPSAGANYSINDFASLSANMVDIKTFNELRSAQEDGE